MSLDGQGLLVIDETADEPEQRTEEPRLKMTGDTGRAIGRVLELVREHLDVDVVFVGEFASGGEIVREVAGDGSRLGIEPGEVISLLESDLLKANGIDASVDVPVRLSPERLYGTLSVRGHSRVPPIGHRDISFMRIIAGVIADRIGQDRARDDLVEAKRDRILHVVERRHDLVVLFQPIVDLRTGRVAGCEALSRFLFPPHRSPDLWFKEAWSVDLGVELELTALQRALEQLDSLPKDTYVSINVSPLTISSGILSGAIPDAASERLVLELTEHESVEDYPSLAEALRGLRRRGVRLAIDDTGAGFASLRHVLRLTPEIIKLDLSLTQNLDADPKRWALADALLRFSNQIGAVVIAEGVENRVDLETLKLIGFPYGQGRVLCRPVAPPLPSVVDLR